LPGKIDYSSIKGDNSERVDMNGSEKKASLIFMISALEVAEINGR
jgi:hypothetical protein